MLHATVAVDCCLLDKSFLAYVLVLLSIYTATSPFEAAAEYSHINFACNTSDTQQLYGLQRVEQAGWLHLLVDMVCWSIKSTCYQLARPLYAYALQQQALRKCCWLNAETKGESTSA